MILLLRYFIPRTVKKFDFINQVTYMQAESSRDEKEFEEQKPITDELEQLLTQMNNDMIMV